jgi:hypothetical protein
MKLDNSTPARVGFIISAYKRPELTERLVHALEGRPCSIHVDKKSSIRPDLERALGGLSNVTFLKQHQVSWGDFGHVAASLEGMRWFQTTDLDYAILLTGQCYPLLPMRHVEEALGRLGGKSLIQHEPFDIPADFILRDYGLQLRYQLARLKRLLGLGSGDEQVQTSPNDQPCVKPTTKPSYWGYEGWRRIKKYKYFVAGQAKTAPFIVRSLPLNLHPYGGSSYWCLSRECVDYVLRFIDENPSVVRFFENSYIPCETFFQTILGNSDLRSTLIDEEVHYVEWSHPNDGTPKTLTDPASALASGKWFARKWESTDALDEIDRRRNLLRSESALSGASAAN